MACVPEFFMKFIVANNFIVQTVYEMSNSALRIQFENLPMKAQKAVTATCSNLLEHYYKPNTDPEHPIHIPTMHFGYYQKLEFNLWINMDEQINVGNLKRGNFLEIFQAEKASDITLQLLDNLKNDSMSIFTTTSHYDNLPYTPMDTCITISLADMELTVSRKMDDTTAIQTFELRLIGLLNLDDFIEEVFKRIVNIPGVTIIVVDTCSSAFEDDPKIVQWLTLFHNAYGDLDNVNIIMIISYDDFINSNLTTKRQVRDAVNSGTNGRYPDKIFWLDLSSRDDIFKEEGNHPLNFELNMLND